MDPSVPAKTNSDLTSSWDGAAEKRKSLSPARVHFLSTRLFSSQQVGLQQCAQEDVAAGSNKRESIPQPAHLISMQIHICFPPYLGPPFEFFFSVPGGPTYAETLLNATTVATQIDPIIWSETVSTCKSTRLTVRDSYSKRAGAPGSRGGLLPAAATWSWP